MSESRVFQLSGTSAAQIAAEVERFLREEKQMTVQCAETGNGFLIQAAQADTLRTLSGMKLATTVELRAVGEQLNVTVGEGQWSDKLGAGAVGLFLLWPLAVTAGIGAYKQKKLPEEILGLIQRITLGVVPAAAQPAYQQPVPRQPAAACPQCGAPLQPGAKFCSACGEKLQSTCPTCGAAVAPGSRFCAACGQALLA